ncbi:MAG: DUF1640 domain-containing protein [Methylococcales bacterium]|nr:DUF1640 domain-containing protein [Methylococcales bacterium]
MTTITFDTQEAVIKLKAVGVSQEHADAFVRAIVESQNSLVTKTDLELALTPIKTDLAVLKADSITLKWMMGVLIAGVMSIVIKTFF